MDRRDILASVAAMFGASLFAPIARAASGVPPLIDPPPVTHVLSLAHRALVTALSERVIPKTDTPGAIAAGVPAYIEKLLSDWSLPEDVAPILNGLDAIDTRSRKDFGIAAADAGPQRQDALLTLAMNGNLEGAGEFFELFRQLVITGYYTSEIGVTQERVFMPVPGRYDGAYPYAQVGRVISS